MIFPERLKKGDTVAIVAPSSPVTKAQADACRQLVENMGYKVKMGQSAYLYLHGNSAGTGAQRAADINGFFADAAVKAIWCLRGGDTSAHVMDKLDYDLIRKNPKIFVGYSDITNYHVNFNQKCDLITFHGPMVKSNMLHDYDDFTRNSFEKMLHMEQALVLENPAGEDFGVLVAGYAEGIVVGGNLALLTSMIGTPYEADTKDKILFLEDVGEDVKRLDRMLHHLKYANKLKDTRGILIGDFLNCFNEADSSYRVIDLFRDVLADYDKPVMYNIKSGHCKPMSTIPLGAHCIVDTERKQIVFSRPQSQTD